jgi:hypothetical protein
VAYKYFDVVAEEGEEEKTQYRIVDLVMALEMKGDNQKKVQEMVL